MNLALAVTSGAHLDFSIDDPHTEALDLSVNASVRVPDERWGDTSSEGRQLWFKMSDKDCAALLGIQKAANSQQTPATRAIP